MWPFQKKEDFVVFIPQPKSKFNILRIDTKIDQATLETRIAHTGELKDKSFAEVAYVRISFKEAANAQQAANIARDDNLIYIPAPFIKAIRQRNPGADIRFIRQQFARRLETYQAARGEEKFSDEDLLKAYEDLTKMFDFSYDTDRIKKGRRYTP